MFTGIINHIGTIKEADMQGDLRLVIACDFAADLRLGESVACNGACLTVVASGQLPVVSEKNNSSHWSLATGHSYFTTQLSAETLARTAPHWQVGQKLNLERALRLGDALDGHLVTGHVDGVATLESIIPSGDSHILCLSAPEALARFIAEKGSITLDGVSLTVNKVEKHRFWVNIIPHTWQHTTLGERKPGDSLNIEIDLMARYAARLMSKQE